MLDVVVHFVGGEGGGGDDGGYFGDHRGGRGRGT